MTISRFQYPADTVKRCPARGEILVPLGAVGFVLMGTLLVSTLLSLQAIQTVLPWMAATGVVTLAAGAVIHIRRVAIKFRLGFIALFCLTVAVGLWLAAGEREKLLEARNLFAGQSLTFSGEISAVEPREDGGCRFLMRDARITAEDGREGNADVLFYSDGELTFYGGERAVLTGTASEELTMSQLGTGAELVVFRAGYVREEQPSWRYPFYRWRSRVESIVRTRLYTLLDNEDTALIVGMLLGNSAAISTQDYTLLQNAGLAHLLAVSGLHISIFFTLTSWLLRPFGRRAALAGSIPVAALYVFLTGMGVSSVRALVMVSLFNLAELLRMPKNNSSVLGTAVLLFCIWEPVCVLQAGTLLSVLSVWCLYAVAPALRVRIPVGKRKFGSVLDGAFACAAISVVTIPVMMLMVGYIPMLAPLCSILVLPLMPVVLTAGLVAGIFGGLLPGRLAGGCLQLLFGYIRAVAAAGGSGPMVPLGGELVKLGVAAALLLMMGLAVICGVRQLSLHRGLVAAMVSVLLAVTGLCGVVPRAEGLRISALEGTLILQKGQQAVVIGSGRSDYAGQTVAGYLRANGVQEYHLLIPEGRMTFTGGCYELLGRFAADSILYTQMDTRLQLALEQFAPAEVCPLTGASRWQLFGEAELEIRPGNNGPYLLLHAGEKTLLLCDGKDSPIYQADWTVYYDHQPEESLSSFAENCGILEITELPFEAGEEMPGWEAGFLCPDWTILVEDQLRLLPG